MMVSLGAVFLDSGIKTITTDEPAVNFRDIGIDFVTYYWPALILMGLTFSRLCYWSTSFSQTRGCGE